MAIKKDKRSRVLKGVLVLYVAALAFLSLNPWVRPSSAPAMGGIPWDKIDHAIAYALLAVIALSAFSRKTRGLGWSMVMAALFAVATGVVLEFCQSWLTESRDFSPADAYANGAGALLGVAGFWGMRVVFRRCRRG